MALKKFDKLNEVMRVERLFCGSDAVWLSAFSEVVVCQNRRVVAEDRLNYRTTGTETLQLMAQVLQVIRNLLQNERKPR